MKNFKKVFMVLTSLLILTALYGCIGGKEEGTSTGDKNSIVVGIQQDIDSLDPYLAEAAGTREVLFNIFEGLVKPDSKGNLIPALAKEYKVFEDNTKYTFTLREGVEFHNGQKVTAEDVKYSLEKNAGLLEDGQVLQSALEAIKEVNIIDSTTVEVVLKEADTEILAFLTVAIVPADYKEQATKPVGTGPYKFVSYKAASEIVLEKNNNYWDEKASIEKVTFKIVANTNSAMIELKAGSIDVFPYLTGTQATELEGEFNILEGSSNMVQALYLNNKVAPFDNETVRKALALATDRQAVSDMVANGNGAIVGSAMFPSFGKYFNEATKDINSKDIEKAKQLLKEAGFEDGFEFTLKVAKDYDFHVDTALVLKEQYKAIGVTVNVETIDWNTWLSQVYVGRDYQATVIAVDADLAPKDMLSRYYSKAENNFINYSSTEYDTYILKAMNTTDDKEKVDNYFKCQEILANEAASVFIQAPPLLVAVNKELEGYEFYPVYVQDLQSIKFKK